MEKEPVTCEYLLDSRLCKAVIEQSEGRQTRNKYCKNSPKNYCCYLCFRRDVCEISCSYLDDPQKSKNLDNATKLKVDRQIRKYQEEISSLASLLANHKIGETSYLAATKTLEGKIDELAKIKNSPSSLTQVEASLEPEVLGESTELVSRRSGLWYLVPFFFGFVGGLIAYIAVEDDDKEMAKSLLVFGICWSVVLAVVGWLIIIGALSRI